MRITKMNLLPASLCAVCLLSVLGAGCGDKEATSRASPVASGAKAAAANSTMTPAQQEQMKASQQADGAIRSANALKPGK